jgi:ribose/xylose/arabinose/galactoside ABC-type transport system permease subunit
MIALGMMVLLIAGFFDLSVGSTMGLAGIVCAMLLHAHLPIPLAVAAAVLFGATFGLVNGVLVAIIGINPLVATLGTMFVGRGIIETIATTQTLTGFTGFPKSFTDLGNAKAGGLYFMLWIFLAIAIVTHVALNRFAWGRQFFFLGSNPNAAHSFGFSTRRIISVAYALAGALPNWWRQYFGWPRECRWSHRRHDADGAYSQLVCALRTRYPVAIGDTRRRLDRRRSLGRSDPPRSQ